MQYVSGKKGDLFTLDNISIRILGVRDGEVLLCIDEIGINDVNDNNLHEEVPEASVFSAGHFIHHDKNIAHHGL